MYIDSFRIFLIVTISLIIFIIIIIVIIYFVKKLLKSKIKINREIIMQNSTNNITQPSPVEVCVLPFNISRNNLNNGNIKEKPKKNYISKELKINAFCNCFLKPVKYSCVKVYNESCPIDLIPFNKNDEVSVTKCSHAFHFNCIKKYLLENNTNNKFKCPICSNILFEIKI